MNWKSYSFGCLTSFVLLFVFLLTASIFAFYGVSNLKGKQITLKNNTYLLIDLKNKMVEYRQISSPFWVKDSPLALNILREKLKAAAKNPQIKGIILKISGSSSLSYSHANELAHLLHLFRAQSGKKVFAYIYSCSDAEFLVASSADKIFLNPSAAAGISFLGINAKKIFLHSFLKKIGLQVKVVRTGDYKSYGQSFTRDSMSSTARAEIKKVYGSLFALYQKQLAHNLSLPVSKIESLFGKKAEYSLSGKSAINIVDSLAYYEQFLTAKKIKNILAIEQYSPKSTSVKTKNKLAVVYLQGSIAFQSDVPRLNIDLQSTKDIFAKIEEDKEVKAIVLRINSPGGSALASHLIAKQVVARCELPVVIFMDGVAASGGYYIASAGDYIVASAYTVTGSIGVCALLPNAHSLGEKLGVNYSGVSYGKFAQSFDISHPQSPQLVNAIQTHIDKVYQEFCYFVAKSRNLPLPTIKNLAQGKIYTAEQAKDLHLIDQVGHLEDAISKAKELAKIDDAKLIFYPKEDNWIESLLQNRLSKIPFLQLFWDADNSLKNKEFIQTRAW